MADVKKLAVVRGRACRGKLCQGRWWPAYAFASDTSVVCDRCKRHEARKLQGQRAQALAARKARDAAMTTGGGSQLCSVKTCDTYVSPDAPICDDCLIRLKMRRIESRLIPTVEGYVYKSED